MQPVHAGQRDRNRFINKEIPKREANRRYARRIIHPRPKRGGVDGARAYAWGEWERVTEGKKSNTPREILICRSAFVVSLQWYRRWPTRGGQWQKKSQREITTIRPLLLLIVTIHTIWRSVQPIAWNWTTRISIETWYMLYICTLPGAVVGNYNNNNSGRRKETYWNLAKRFRTSYRRRTHNGRDNDRPHPS